MNDVQTILNSKIRQGRVMLGLGLVLLAVGIALRVFFPGSGPYAKGAEAFGIVLVSLGVSALARYGLARRNPHLARQRVVDDLDERNIALRHQAGNAAFMVSFALSSLGLIVYSLLTQGQPADVLWVWMAVLVLGPALFYVVDLVRLNSQS